MHKKLLSILLFSALVGCGEILREPELDLENTEPDSGGTVFDVSEYKATPGVVDKANQTPFIRYVNVGGNNSSSVKRVREKQLFAGPKLPTRERPDYKIRIGDVLLVNTYGFSNLSGTNSVLLDQQNEYVVSERGEISLKGGRSVFVLGKTIAGAKKEIQREVGNQNSRNSPDFLPREFPTNAPAQYRLGVGDIISFSQLIETSDSNGGVRKTALQGKGRIGPLGSFSIQQLGEIEAAGLTLSQVRNLVLQEVARNGILADIVVEIEEFASQSLLVTGTLGTKVIPLNDQAASIDRLLAELEPSFERGKDYIVTLERENEKYQMLASSVLFEKERDRYFLHDGDRVSVQEVLPTSWVDVQITQFSDRNLTYTRAVSENSIGSNLVRAVPFDLRGIDLRQLLISQGVVVSQNTDLLVTVHRTNRAYNFSAQSIVLNNPNVRYWLAPDDHVVVQDLAYVGDSALLVGEFGTPKQLLVNKFSRTTLSEALFEGAAFSAEEADFSHIYVLRGAGFQFKAYHFDITQVLNLNLAEDFELRPGDIVFVRTRPISKYTRALTSALNLFRGLDGALTEARTFGR